MNFDEYRPLALRTAKMFPKQREDLRHAALGLITEIGEFATEVKRHVIYGKPMDDAMVKHMREELGDAMWYVPLALTALGMERLPEADDGAVKESKGMLVDIGNVPPILSTFAATLAAESLQANTSTRYELAAYLALIVAMIEHVAVNHLGTTGDQLRAENIDKLRLRFPDKYSDAAAEARADKGGLPANVS